MNRKRYSKTLISVLVATFIFSTSLALAESVTFQREYTYHASEADSKISCRTIALEQVKRLLLEELGTYLEAETEVRDYQLTKDKITTLTAGLVKTEIVNEKWDGKEYWLKARIAADPEKVAKSIEALRNDRQKSRELEKTRRKADAASREIARLRKELAFTKRKSDTKKLRRYNETINELRAIDWLQKGWALENSGDYLGALNAFTRAIKLDPTNAEAYSERGVIYADYIGKDRQALADFNRAIELDPKLAIAYNNRGIIYRRSGQLFEALRDCNRAIKIDSQLAVAFNTRGIIYAELGNYPQALKDFNRAIQLKPRAGAYYSNRASIYTVMGLLDKALRDRQTAMRLIQKEAETPLSSISRGGSPHESTGIYKWTDEKGVVHFSQDPPSDVSAELDKLRE